jgi:hypothetical protein
MLHDPDELRTSPRGRFVAIGVAAAGIAALVYAGLSTRWLITGSGTGLGLRTFEVCHALGCDQKAIADLPAHTVSASLERAGLMTWITIWISVGGLAVAVLPMIAGARAGIGRIGARVAVLALMVALGGAVWFVLSRPGTSEGKSTFALSFGFWAFCAGDILALTAGQLLGKLHAPADSS